MKTTNNETIFEQIKTRGYMTEREMCRRFFNERKGTKETY